MVILGGIFEILLLKFYLLILLKKFDKLKKLLFYSNFLFDFANFLFVFLIFNSMIFINVVHPQRCSKNFHEILLRNELKRDMISCKAIKK
jgi:hypothetical protein